MRVKIKVGCLRQRFGWLWGEDNSKEFDTIKSIHTNRTKIENKSKKMEKVLYKKG